MHTIANRGGPQEAHRGANPASPDWESVRTFLELVRYGSFRSAAERLGLSPNALRRKIEDLERTLGTILVTRHVDGIRTTAEGDRNSAWPRSGWRKPPSGWCAPATARFPR